MPAAGHTVDSDGGELDFPISFKRSSASLKKNITHMHTPSSASLKLNTSAQHCHQKSNKLKRLRVEDDLTDSDDEKPIALRKNVCGRKSKNVIDTTTGAKVEDDHDDSDDDKPIASTKVALPSLRMFDGDDDQFDAPISFKRSSSCVKKNTMPTPTFSSGNAVKPNGSSAQHRQKSKVKRLRVEDVLTPDTDSDDEKPVALRMKVCERKSKGFNRKSAKPDDDHDHDSDDEKPIALRRKVYKIKLERINRGGAKADDDHDHDSDDEKPLATRLANNNTAPKNAGSVSDGDSEDDKPLTARFPRVIGAASRDSVKRLGDRRNQTGSALKKAKLSDSSDSSSVESEPKDAPEDDGRKKWTTLEHNGVVFPPSYKPHGVKMHYNGQPVYLTPEQEEVATMFAVMKETEYASKETFINNFFTDWRKILGKTHIIKKFELCDFTPIYEWHLREKEKKSRMTSEEKKALQEEKSKLEEVFMRAYVDSVEEKVGNFRVEPPGLFRGRGEHPKMGRLKRRIRPSDITINIGEGAPVPLCPIPGERWKEVKHDNTVTWLACWNDPINEKDIKYVFLAASSSLKGQSDKEKYEKARKLKDYIDMIRANYTKDFRSEDQVKKQIAEATYLIDKLALRAGNEKDEDEADTVGCCTLKFDFLGKDSIRYYNTVEVELPVYEAIKEFCAGKNKGGHVFDKLDTTKLNAHLKDLMPGLTAKVFRTYNASITLDAILNKETKDGTLDEKIGVYQRANKEVAIICNHQRAVPKSHDSQMNKLNEKIDELTDQRDQLNVELEKAKKHLSKMAKKRKPVGTEGDRKPKRKLTPEMLEKKLSQIDIRIAEMDKRKNRKEDLKTVALGTSKINYLDPRITVAWCKTHEVPINEDKIPYFEGLPFASIMSYPHCY